MRDVLIAAAALLALAGSAEADEVTDRTPCSVAVKAFEDRDMDAIREVGRFIKNTMQDLDFAHTDNGEPGIMAGMNDHSRSTAIASAVGFCRQHPNATIYNEAAASYDGLRDIEMQFGTAK